MPAQAASSSISDTTMRFIAGEYPGDSYNKAMQAPAPAAPAFGFDAALLAARAAALGVPVATDAWGPAADLPLPATWAEGLAVPLLDLGLIAAEGPDALAFLQSQLTQDVEQLPADAWRWFGFCTAKGRLQAIFAGWRADLPDSPAVRLALPLPLIEVLRRRLSMFVLRAKVRLHDRSAERVAFGLAGAGARAWLQDRLGEVPSPQALARAAGLDVLGLEPVDAGPCGGGRLERWVVECPAAEAPALWRDLGGRLAPVPGTLWRWLDVLSGVPRVFPATWEAFVPQMVNLEVVGGVSFRKGCYPGQEVVARSQYLGRLKRRMFLGHVATDAPPPGADVLAPDRAEPCGQVVLAAPAPAGGAHLLFECQIAAFEAGGLSVAGASIVPAPLPYELPSLDAPARA
jgi:folate-binding protein YgfZ